MKHWITSASLMGLLALAAPADAAPQSKNSAVEAEPQTLRTRKAPPEAKLSELTKQQLKAREDAQKGRLKPLAPERNVMSPHWAVPLGHQTPFAKNAVETFAEGRLVELGDGAIRLAFPMSEEARKAQAQTRGVNIAQIPSEYTRWYKMANARTDDEIFRRRMNQSIRVEIKRDKRGFALVTKVSAPR